MKEWMQVAALAGISLSWYRLHLPDKTTRQSVRYVHFAPDLLIFVKDFFFSSQSARPNYPIRLLHEDRKTKTGL